MELPIVVSVDELNVGAFVSQLDLSVDVGPQGRRGSITFAGNGAPPTNPTTEVTNIYGMVDTFLPGDLYINTGVGAKYSYLYIYQANPLGDEWVAICPINPILYYSKLSFTFTAGASATKNIPLTSIFGTSTTAIPASDFIISAVALDSGTNVHVFSVKSIAVDNGAGNLDVVLNGRTLAATTVANASGAIEILFSVGVKSD